MQQEKTVSDIWKHLQILKQNISSTTNAPGVSEVNEGYETY